MSSFFHKVSELVTGRRKHFEKVCEPEWQKIDEVALKEDFPYCTVLDNILMAVLAQMERDFIDGAFGRTLSKVEPPLVRQIVAIYAYYGVYVFTRTDLCNDLVQCYENFDTDGLWRRVKSVVPEWREIEENIDGEMRAQTEPMVMFVHVLAGVVLQGTGQEPEGGQKLREMPDSYSGFIKGLTEKIEKDVIAYEKKAPEEPEEKTAIVERQQEEQAQSEEEPEETHTEPKTEQLMWIKTACPNCGKHLKATPDKAGKKAKCPQCGTRVEIPPESDRS